MDKSVHKIIIRIYFMALTKSSMSQFGLDFLCRYMMAKSIAKPEIKPEVKSSIKLIVVPESELIVEPVLEVQQELEPIIESIPELSIESIIKPIIGLNIAYISEVQPIDASTSKEDNELLNIDDLPVVFVSDSIGSDVIYQYIISFSIFPSSISYIFLCLYHIYHLSIPYIPSIT